MDIFSINLQTGNLIIMHDEYEKTLVLNIATTAFHKFLKNNSAYEFINDSI